MGRGRKRGREPNPGIFTPTPSRAEVKRAKKVRKAKAPKASPAVGKPVTGPFPFELKKMVGKTLIGAVESPAEQGAWIRVYGMRTGRGKPIAFDEPPRLLWKHTAPYPLGTPVSFQIDFKNNTLVQVIACGFRVIDGKRAGTHTTSLKLDFEAEPGLPAFLAFPDFGALMGPYTLRTIEDGIASFAPVNATARRILLHDFKRSKAGFFSPGFSCFLAELKKGATKPAIDAPIESSATNHAHLEVPAKVTEHQTQHTSRAVLAGASDESELRTKLVGDEYVVLPPEGQGRRTARRALLKAQRAARKTFDDETASVSDHDGAPSVGLGLLHAVAISCPWVLVSSVEAVRRYRGRLVENSLFFLIPTDSNWLYYRDVWEGGLGDAWQAAVAAPDTVVLVCLEAIDRSLVTLWARPFFLLSSGIIETLPDGQPWPANLRIFATCEKASHSFPLDPEALSYFAALPADDDVRQMPDFAALTPLDDSSWLSLTPQNLTGPAVHRRANLSAVLSRLLPSAEPGVIDEHCNRILVEWPNSYLPDNGRRSART